MSPSPLLMPVVELGAGLSYQGEYFFLRAGYEVTDWINMVSRFGGPGSNGSFPARKRGDLTLEALTLRFGFAF